MGEPQVNLSTDGQECQEDDINQLGQVAGLADDHVFAELFRMTLVYGGGGGGAVAKGILPFGLENDTHYDPGGAPVGTVAPSASDGSIKIRPFRAFVGARSNIAVDGMLQAWRDIRSGIYAVSDDNSTPGHVVALAANTSGNPRWDLVYAAFAADANGPSVTRYIKPASGGAVAPASVVTTLVQAITIGVVTGTPGATPVIPSAPADAGGTYYIAMAFVLVPNGFGGSSAVNKKDIYDCAPVRPLSRTMGLSSMVPAGESNRVGGTVLSGGMAPPATTASRTPPYLPASMSGEEGIFVALDLSNASTGAWSHPPSSVIDVSRDWRNRMFQVVVAADASKKFAWDSTIGSGNALPGALTPPILRVGQGFVADSAGIFSVSGLATVAYLQNADLAAIASGSFVAIGVSMSTGNLELHADASTLPGCRLMVWIRATGTFPNF